MNANVTDVDAVLAELRSLPKDAFVVALGHVEERELRIPGAQSGVPLRALRQIQEANGFRMLLLGCNTAAIGRTSGVHGEFNVHPAAKNLRATMRGLPLLKRQPPSTYDFLLGVVGGEQGPRAIVIDNSLASIETPTGRGPLLDQLDQTQLSTSAPETTESRLLARFAFYAEPGITATANASDTLARSLRADARVAAFEGRGDDRAAE